MSGGVQSFFASLSPETQSELVRAASGALSAQHRSINRNTADASRVRQHLVENDAFAQEQMQRMQPNGAVNDESVSNFQRQNDAFMKLMGDDLMPAPQNAQPAPRSAPKKQSSAKPYPLAEDPVNPDARPANVAQDEATSPYNRDRMPQNAQDSQTATQEAPSGSGETDSLDPMPYLLAALGIRSVAKGAQAVGGRANASVPTNTTPDGGKEVGMARAQGDGIIDAEWSDVEQPKQLSHEQRKLPAPNGNAERRALPLPDDYDEFDDVQKILAQTLGRDEPKRNFEKSNVKEGEVNPNNKDVPKGAGRNVEASKTKNVDEAVSNAVGKNNKANVIRGKKVK